MAAVLHGKTYIRVKRHPLLCVRRSCSMLSVYINGVNRVTGLRFKGKLHLVDLAGSERLAKSGAVGDRREEAVNINRCGGVSVAAWRDRRVASRSLWHGDRSLVVKRGFGVWRAARCRPWVTSFTLARASRRTSRSGTRR